MKNYIALEAVESSRIAAIGYDESQQRLAIKFKPTKTGPESIYHYNNVEPETWEAFRTAESIGAFFGKVINDPKVYPFMKCEGVALELPEVAKRLDDSFNSVTSVLVPRDIDQKGQSLVTQASSFISQAQARAQRLLAVTATNAEYEASANDLALIKGRFNEIDSHREFLKAPHLEGVRRVDGYFQPVLKTLKAAEEFVKQKQVAYRQRLEDKRREAQRLADEAAAKERKRLADEAAAARAKAEAEAAEIRRRAEAEAAETRRRAEAEAAEAKRKAEAAIAAGRAQEAARIAAEAEQRRIAAEAEAAEARRKAEAKAKAKIEKADAKADVLEQQSQVVSAQTIADDKPKVAGQREVEVYTYEIDDENLIPRTYLMPNDKMLADMARATKGKVPVPGVRFFPKKILASSAKK